jgi:hypothetical protein
MCNVNEKDKIVITKQELFNGLKLGLEKGFFTEEEIMSLINTIKHA